MIHYTTTAAEQVEFLGLLTYATAEEESVFFCAFWVLAGRLWVRK